MSRPYEPNDPGYVIKTESREMTRSEVAKGRRALQEMNDTLLAVERQLLSDDLTSSTALEVAEKIVLASNLRKKLQDAVPMLQGSMPNPGNARLSDGERRQIKGYYHTGNYTQEQLADQFQVSQATVSNIVSEDDEPDV